MASNIRVATPSDAAAVLDSVLPGCAGVRWRDAGDPDGGGMLSEAPRGVVRVLLEPFPWEVHNVNSGLASFENLLIAWFLLRYGLITTPPVSGERSTCQVW